MSDDLEQRIASARSALYEAEKAKRDAGRAAEEEEIAATLVEHARLVGARTRPKARRPHERIRLVPTLRTRTR